MFNNKISEYVVHFMITLGIFGFWWLLFGGGALGSPSYGWAILLEVTK